MSSIWQGLEGEILPLAAPSGAKVVAVWKAFKEQKKEEMLENQRKAATLEVKQLHVAKEEAIARAVALREAELKGEMDAELARMREECARRVREATRRAELLLAKLRSNENEREDTQAIIEGLENRAREAEAQRARLEEEIGEMRAQMSLLSAQERMGALTLAAAQRLHRSGMTELRLRLE